MTTPTYLTGTTQARAYRLLRSHVYGVLEKYRLTPTHWSMLGLISEAKRRGIQSSDIALLMHVKAPLVTMITRELITRGYVDTTPHAIDKRAKILTMTSDGKKFIKAVESDLRTIVEQLLAGLTEHEIQTYYKVLVRMIENGERLGHS